jgi:hypothetical protein
MEIVLNVMFFVDATVYCGKGYVISLFKDKF